MTPQRRRERPPVLPQKLGDLPRELVDVSGVEGGDVSEEHGEVAELLGDGGVGGGGEGGVTAEEVEGGVEVAEDEVELR